MGIAVSGKRPRASGWEARTAVEERSATPSKVRLVSLDIFRGLTVLGMLLVNNIALGDATPVQLVHAGWNGGVHFADLVFPWFLFTAGVAIPYAVASRREKQVPWSHVVRQAAGRALVLVLLGCLLDSSVARQPVLGLGVLQLIGLAYFAALLFYPLPASRRIATAVFLLALHWAALRFYPVPGHGAGVIAPGAHLVHYLNVTYLQPFHLAGVASVIPTTALVLLGTLAGDLLRLKREVPSRKALLLLGLGGLLAGLGWLWNLDLPFNKALWTAPFIVYSGGLGLAALALCYYLADVRGYRWWTFPLVALGANAIFAYAVPILVKTLVLQQWHWTMPDGSHLSLQDAGLHALISHLGRLQGGLAYTALYIVAWWAVLAYLYRRKIFLRI